MNAKKQRKMKKSKAKRLQRTTKYEPGVASKYSKKKTAQQKGHYTGSSPFYYNIPEFQHLLPLSAYPHLRKLNAY